MTPSAALAVAGVAAPAFGQAGAASAPSGGAARAFPHGFRWGVATSAYQIEGATQADGRGESIWDAFARLPGRIQDARSGDTAADHYRRYRDDVRLMRSLGVGGYRFSIAWPRVLPEGRGAPNPAGIAFYDRLVDALLEQGIEPYPTLYHWDLPQALQTRLGGWASRDTAAAFADYAAIVAARLGDRVRRWTTTNELLAFVELGYGQGVFAPGLSLPRAALNQVRHHALLGHGLAVQAVRAHARGEVGLAENAVIAVPITDAPGDVLAAERATRALNAGYLTAILEGRYLDGFLAEQGADAPRFTDAELRTIAAPLDFVGLNIYKPDAYVVAADDVAGFRALPVSASHPRMASAWHLLDPAAMYWGVRNVARVWRPNAIYITENGCAADDAVGAGGVVADTDRVMFLRAHLAELARAIADGAPVRGYFLWSLLDNFEWADGYTRRFGIVHVDFASQRRTLKLSGDYYRRVVAANRVM